MTEQSKPTIRTIRILGWSAIIISMVVIISESASLLFYNPMGQLDFVIQSYPQLHLETLRSYTNIFQYSRIWSIYSILYFVVVLFGAIQFVQFRATGRALLEIVCNIGILNAFVDTYLNYHIWKNMQTIMVSFMGNMGIPLRNLNPFGMVTIIGGFFLWIVPSIGLILYLRRPSLKALMK